METIWSIKIKCVSTTKIATSIFSFILSPAVFCYQIDLERVVFVGSISPSSKEDRDFVSFDR